MTPATKPGGVELLALAARVEQAPAGETADFVFATCIHLGWNREATSEKWMTWRALVDAGGLIDAVLSLCAEKLPGREPLDLVYDALEAISVGGWKQDEPRGPLIARYTLSELLRALAAKDDATRKGEAS